LPHWLERAAKDFPTAPHFLLRNFRYATKILSEKYIFGFIFLSRFSI
jgi:hypothetical protein